jgi:hypothetical protein
MIKKEREESLSANHIKKYRKRQYMEHVWLYFWAYTRKNSAIASGATPIGSAVVHPIERSRQKKNRNWSQ